MTPAPGGPADTAGIKPGDVIAAIDGRPTRGLSLYEAADLLQGAEGTEATLSLRRARGQLQVVALTRARLAVKPVLAQLCGDGVAYVRIAAFAKNTTPEMRGALGALRAAGARAYVIDLRNNGGGYFPSSVEVGRMLIQGGDIVLIADSDGVRDVYGATGDALLPSAPLSVLINQGTGSAAEVWLGWGLSITTIAYVGTLRCWQARSRITSVRCWLERPRLARGSFRRWCPCLTAARWR